MKGGYLKLCIEGFKGDILKRKPLYHFVSHFLCKAFVIFKTGVNAFQGWSNNGLK